ncbi:hypothetical protein BH20GEM2_BH20GEM2_01060 [soil metagenome]
MQSIEVRCRCGEVYRADATQVGRRLRCRCGRTPLIRRSTRAGFAASAKDAATRLRGAIRRRLLRDSGPLSRKRARAAGSAAPAACVTALVWLATGYLLAAVLAWLALWTLGERWWPATVFLYGPRWLLLLPLALLVPCAALLRPRLLFPLLAGSLIVLGPVMGLRVGWRRWLPIPQEVERVRVLTLNTEGQSGVQQGVMVGLARVLLRTSPDVILIQECGQELAVAFAFLPGWHHGAEEGLCVLSRYRILATARFDGTGMEFARERRIGGSGRAIAYTLDVPGGPMRLVNLHLETPRKGLERLFHSETAPLRVNTELRRIQSRQVAAWVATLGPSLVVAGDFNLPVESPIYRQGWGDFRNAFSRMGFGFGMTRYNGWIRVRIDHVLTRGEWRAIRARVGPDVRSDHRPVIAELVRAGSGG